MPWPNSVGITIFLAAVIAGLVLLLGIGFAPRQCLDAFDKADLKIVLGIWIVATIALLGWWMWKHGQKSRAPSERHVLKRAIEAVITFGLAVSGSPVILGLVGKVAARTGDVDFGLSFRSIETSGGFTFALTVVSVVILCFRYRSAPA
jgi:hypothetical protein